MEKDKLTLAEFLAYWNPIASRAWEEEIHALFPHKALTAVEVLTVPILGFIFWVFGWREVAIGHVAWDLMTFGVLLVIWLPILFVLKMLLIPPKVHTAQNIKIARLDGLLQEMAHPIEDVQYRIVETAYLAGGPEAKNFLEQLVIYGEVPGAITSGKQPQLDPYLDAGIIESSPSRIKLKSPFRLPAKKFIEAKKRRESIDQIDASNSFNSQT